MEEIRLLFSDLIGWLSRIGVGSVFTLVVTLGALWVWRKKDNMKEEIHRLDTKLAAIDTKFDSKFDALNTLLTDKLISFADKVGELKGQSHTHLPSG